MKQLFLRADRWLLLTVVSLALLGLYNLASASLPLGLPLHRTHALHLLIGTMVMVTVASVPYRHLEALAVPILVGTVGLLLATDLFGKIINGSRRWLPLGPLNLQTSELAKIAVIIIMAKSFRDPELDGQLTLRKLFRPMNISRPAVLLLVVLVTWIGGDAIRPARLERPQGQRYRVVKKLSAKNSRIRLGRSIDSTIRLRGAGLNQEHAEVVRIRDGDYRVRDLDSSTGTWVNGERIEGERRLRDGDMLSFGVSGQGELRFSASMQSLGSKLAWAFALGLVWMAFAVHVQLKKRKLHRSDVVAPLDLVAIPAFLILVQPDLGTSIIVLLIAGTMILFVGLQRNSLIAGFIGLLIIGALSWKMVLQPYQKERVLTFLNPTSDLAGAGYHQHQSLIAVGSGGYLGKGHGLGTQTQLSFLPEQQTDFIFSVWAEEHGFLGSVVVVLLFVMLITLSGRVATRAWDRFGALLAVGSTALLFWHTVVNMLMVLRLAPVVGVPLPLWSNGGSFVVTAMVALGLIFNVSMRRNLF